MLRFLIDDLVVSFPYPNVYPEQYQYMCELKRTLDSEVNLRSPKVKLY
jgi:DNA excision repair protein ERCC-2